MVWVCDITGADTRVIRTAGAGGLGGVVGRGGSWLGARRKQLSGIQPSYRPFHPNRPLTVLWPWCVCGEVSAQMQCSLCGQSESLQMLNCCVQLSGDQFIKWSCYHVYCSNGDGQLVGKYWNWQIICFRVVLCTNECHLLLFMFMDKG